MNGVLISHGITQKHIWAYAVGFERQPLKAFITLVVTIIFVHILTTFNCTVPPFIGNDYYCDG